MTWDLDPRAEALEAMRQAVAATNEFDRAKWLRIALAFQVLATDKDAEPIDNSGQTAA